MLSMMRIKTTLAIAAVTGMALIVRVQAQNAQQDKSAVSEQTRKQAESPFKWILLHSKSDSKSVPAKAEPSIKDNNRGTPGVDTPIKGQGTESPISKAEQSSVGATEPQSPERDLAKTVSATPSLVSTSSSTIAPAVPVPLKLLKQVSPEIPSRLFNDILEDTVVARCTISTDGVITQVKIIRSTNPRLDTYVSAALKLWRYQPIDRERQTDVTVIIRPQ